MTSVARTIAIAINGGTTMTERKRGVGLRLTNAEGVGAGVSGCG